jgi:hypothetical protein
MSGASQPEANFFPNEAGGACHKTGEPDQPSGDEALEGTLAQEVAALHLHCQYLGNEQRHATNTGEVINANDHCTLYTYYSLIKIFYPRHRSKSRRPTSPTVPRASECTSEIPSRCRRHS